MKRRLFAEITEGFDALAKQRAGKATLRSVEVSVKSTPEVTAVNKGNKGTLTLFR